MEEFLNIIYDWLFYRDPNMVYAEPLTAGAIAAIGGTLISGLGALFGGGAKKREAYRARVERDRLKGELSVLEKNRQAIINPYAGVTDISSMAKDLSGMVSNPYASLGVATQAAEIQIEQTDIALANTLDTIAATGAGAGGATALAQAALQSKRGVAADIQRQEAQNQKLRASGEQQANQQLLSLEQQKLSLEGRKIDIEGQAISAEERAAGGRSDREQAEIDRLYGEYDFQRSTEIANRQASSDAIIGGLQTVGGAGLSIAGAGLAPTPSAINPTSSTPNYENNVDYFGSYNAPYTANPNPVPTYTVPSYSNPGATSGVDITGGQTAVDLSDRRLKHNYKVIGKSKSGLNIYEFSYINKPGRYTGVMSDEISKEAVVVDENGYDMVDYSKIDVDFKKL